MKRSSSYQLNKTVEISTHETQINTSTDSVSSWVDLHFLLPTVVERNSIYKWVVTISSLLQKASLLNWKRKWRIFLGVSLEVVHIIIFDSLVTFMLSIWLKWCEKAICVSW